MINSSFTIHPDYDAERRSIEVRRADGDSAITLAFIERCVGATVRSDLRIHGKPATVLALLDEMRDEVLAFLDADEPAPVAELVDF